jgi:hypothetical protein
MPHLPKPITVSLEYTDVDGIETRRTLDVQRTAKKAGYSMITGWCHGRQAVRSFRSDRVNAVVTEDGEVFTAEEFLETLSPNRPKEVNMAPASLPTSKAQTPLPIESAGDEKRTEIKSAWATALFILFMSPAMIFATLFVLLERDWTGAIFAFVLFGAPVLLGRWIYRAFRRRKTHLRKKD